MKHIEIEILYNVAPYKYTQYSILGREVLDVVRQNEDVEKPSIVLSG